MEYVEDRDADVDMNLVMTGSGKIIEVQGSGEEATFTRKQLDAPSIWERKGFASLPRSRRRRQGMRGLSFNEPPRYIQLSFHHHGGDIQAPGNLASWR